MSCWSSACPYESYYWSPEHRDDQPPFPTTLFVVDTEEVEDTYVRTAARMSRMSLPILLSCIPVLSITGILGRSWRPLWTFYRWRSEYGGLRIDQARRLKRLESENSRLRRAVADLTLDNQILQEAAGGNF